MYQNKDKAPDSNNTSYTFQIYGDDVLNQLLELKKCKEIETFCKQLGKVLAFNYGSEPKLTNLKNAINLKFIEIAIPIMVDEAIKMLKTPPKELKLILNPGTLNVSYDHIFALLSLCFFNLLIKQDSSLPPRFNYIELFNLQQFAPIQVEKLKGHLHYFLEYSQQFRSGFIQITKLGFDSKYHGSKFGQPTIANLDFEVWSKSQQDLGNLLFVDKPIEHIHDGIIVDFADKKFGGFSFYKNIAQEETMLLCKPESLVGVLLISELREDEAILIQGCYDYNWYKGYRKNFQVIPIQPIFKHQIILAIDAQNYSRNTNRQYTKECINRDLNKAFIGFSYTLQKNVSTGKWGCGIFKGDWMLKLILQWLAFSQCETNTSGRKLYFSLFGEKNLTQEINQISKKYKNVGNLYQAIIKYVSSNSFKKVSILDYLIQN